MFRTFVHLVVASALGVLLAGGAFAQDKVPFRLSLTSQPEGASVVLDDEARGTTPLTLYNIAPGRHHVRFSMTGYTAEDAFFDTAEAPALARHADLAPVKGLLLVKSDPPGATILIDGTARGVTPRLFTDLNAKDAYQLKLRKAGYVDQLVSLKFGGRAPKVIDEKLVLDAGVVEIISDPPGADVVVNGVERGKTPTLVKGISKGRASVKFTLEGFEDEVRELALRAGDSQTLSVTLKPKPGTLHLVSVPEGARFYLNDEARGAGPLAIPSLKPGDYTVRAEKAGFATVTRTVHIVNGQSAREEFRLSNVMGRIEVRTEPVGAQIIVDGHRAGTTKAAAADALRSDALPVENLLEGEHVIVIRKAGYAEVTRHPKVAPSETVKVNVRLKRVFVPDVELETIHGPLSGVLVSQTPESVVLEVSLGVQRTVPRAEIRKFRFLRDDK